MQIKDVKTGYINLCAKLAATDRCKKHLFIGKVQLIYLYNTS